MLDSKFPSAMPMMESGPIEYCIVDCPRIMQTMLDMSSRRWRVCFAFCTLLFISSFDTIVVVVVVGDDAVDDDNDDDEEERDEANVRRTASRSRMAVLASLTKSDGCLRLGRQKSVAPPDCCFCRRVVAASLS